MLLHLKIAVLCHGYQKVLSAEVLIGHLEISIFLQN